MTKQDVIAMLDKAGFDEAERNIFLNIIANENEGDLSLDTIAKITDALDTISRNIATEAGVTLEEDVESDEEIQELEDMQKDLEDAEKMLSSLDMAERDLDIAYSTTKSD